MLKELNAKLAALQQIYKVEQPLEAARVACESAILKRELARSPSTPTAVRADLHAAFDGLAAARQEM